MIQTELWMEHIVSCPLTNRRPLTYYFPFQREIQRSFLSNAWCEFYYININIFYLNISKTYPIADMAILHISKTLLKVGHVSKSLAKSVIESAFASIGH